MTNNHPDAGPAFASTASVTCRTVLDLRSPRDKFVIQTMLLAASWHRHCRDHSRLEVFTIGRQSLVVSRFLEALGVTETRVDPGANDSFSKNSNKIQGAYSQPDGAPVLLLDNDVCLLGDISELLGLSMHGIAAAEPGLCRVSDAQWEVVTKSLGVPLLRMPFEAINARLLPRRGKPFEESYLYLNSGVVLLPSGHDHRALWAGLQRRIHDVFSGHPLASDAVTSSDQAGFAASVAAYGRFAWLPLRFNYRRVCFALGLEPADRIAIVHMTGDLPEDSDLNRRLHAYWEQFILGRFKSLPDTLPASEHERRLEIALDVRERIVDVVNEYDIEHYLEEFRCSQSKAVP